MVPPFRLGAIFGPMCSSKTATLISLASTARPRHPSLVVVRHALDARAHDHSPAAATAHAPLTSRTGATLAVHHSVPSLRALPPPRAGALYVVDEAQFFPPGDLLWLWGSLAPLPGAALLAAGLDLDFARRPFGATLELAAAARALGREGLVAPLTARCCHRGAPSGPPCGAPAPFTQRLAAGGAGQLVVGGAAFYRPACAAHHEPAPIEGSAWAEEA